MKRRSKSRILCTVLATTMVLSLFPVNAIAENGGTDSQQSQIVQIQTDDAAQDAAPQNTSEYLRDFEDGESFNRTDLVGLNSGAVQTVEGGMLKLAGFKSGRFLDADSPMLADGELKVRFQATADLDRFGFCVRTKDNASQRLFVVYDFGGIAGNDDTPETAGWYWYGNGGNGQIMHSAMPKAGRWYTMTIRYVGADLQVKVEDEQEPANSAEGSVTIPAQNAYTGAGQAGVVHWSNFDAKDIIIDYMYNTPAQAEPPAEPASVELSSENGVLTLEEGGSLQVNARVLPENAPQQVTWSVENGTGEATVDAAGLVTGVKEGTVTVKAAAGAVQASLELTVTPRQEQEVLPYHRSFDDSDPVGEFHYTDLQGVLEQPVLEDGSLHLGNFQSRFLDADSPLHTDGVMTVRFKLGENSGRFGFYLRTVSAAERIMVAFDTDGWYWYGQGSAKGLLGSYGALDPDTWYVAKITYVGNEIKMTLKNETTGKTDMIGQAVMQDVPSKPGQVGLVSWYGGKEVWVDDLLIEEYVPKQPTDPKPYEPVQIKNDKMTVTLDNRYPTANRYELTDGRVMEGQPTDEYLFEVQIDGNRYEAQVTDLKAEGSKAVYTLEADLLKAPDLPEEGSYGNAVLQVECTLEDTSLLISTKALEEPEGFLIHSVQFPGQKLLRAGYSTAAVGNVSVAGMHAGGGYNSVSDRVYDLAADTYTSVLGGSNVSVGKPFSAVGTTVLTYPFFTDNDLAGTILNNIDATNSKTQVMLETTSAQGREVAMGNGAWDYRGPEVDADTADDFAPLDSMWTRVVITGDCNGDEAIDWQDAAVAHREYMVVPAGGEDIRDYVTYIMYNAASKAQSDTNVSADMLKKLYNLYDGFGQYQMQKGYQAEGHDDAHNDAGGHISERIGGVEGFRELLATAREYNTKIGVHVNITEMMLDAFYPNATMFKGFESGKLQRNWQWYDTAFMMDEDKDLLSGNLESRFAQLAADTTLEGEDSSALGWIYVDIYGRSDWHSRQVAQMFEKYGWWTATEFSGPFEQNTVWTHWGTDLYYPTSGTGSKFQRFLKNGTADIFPANSPAVSTLLKGMQQPSVNAWVNQYEIGESISLFYQQNLPTKYLQHFDILTWNDDNTRITMTDGVVSELKGDKLYISRNGKTYAICDVTATGEGKLDVRADSLVFIPWDPVTEDKVYHWNPDGGKTTWDIPDTWAEAGVTTAYLYENTQNGKVFVAQVPVVDGMVTIDAEADTPYSLYTSREAAEQAAAAGDWSENSPVKDTGFDSRAFVDEGDPEARWNRTAADGTADHVATTKDVRFNDLLTIGSAEDAEVWQQMTGLEPGRSYAVSVWALIENDTDRRVTLRVDGAEEGSVESYLTKTDVKAIKNKFQNTYFRRMRVIFTADETGTARIRLCAADGSNADSRVFFDDVRVFEYVTDAPENNHYYFDDFENVDFSLGALEHDSTSSDNVHLADMHPDFNNGANQYMTYVLDGRYSGKINDTATPVGNSILRTHPSVLRFAPGTTFKVSIDYYTPIDGAYKLVAKNSAGEVLAELPLPKNGEPYAIGEIGTQPDAGKRKPVGSTVSFQFETGSDENCYLSLVKTAETKDRTNSYLILDTFTVDVVGGPEPTAQPTAEPTAQPTAAPTAQPTAEPTAQPTAQPTAAPQPGPDATVTPAPTQAPAAQPDSSLPATGDAGMAGVLAMLLVSGLSAMLLYKRRRACR